MKRTILMFAACLMSIGHALSSDVLTVDDVSLRQGGVATISIGCDFEKTFKGYQFDLELSGGLSLVLDENDKPVWANGFEGTDHTVSSTVVSEGKYRFVCVSTSNTALPSNGILLKVKVEGTESMSVGDSFIGTITAVEFTTVATEVNNLPDVSFTINIIDPWIILDENATAVPEASEENAKVRVLRTINADEWSTLVLPFDMTEAQVKAAFGDDVQIAEYIDHEMNGDGTQLTVNFDNANLAEDGLMANNPYIIKTASDITEFSVDGVTIAPDEEGAIAEYTNGRSGSRKVVYGTFRGTYHAQTAVPNNCLFLSGNQFWYSKGKTKMKAFRAYFDFVEVLASVEDFGSRIVMHFVDDETTGIGNVNANDNENDNRYYDLQGRRVEKPGKGLYIRNGKKEVVK